MQDNVKITNEISAISMLQKSICLLFLHIWRRNHFIAAWPVVIGLIILSILYYNKNKNCKMKTVIIWANQKFSTHVYVYGSTLSLCCVFSLRNFNTSSTFTYSYQTCFLNLKWHKISKNTGSPFTAYTTDIWGA